MVDAPDFLIEEILGVAFRLAVGSEDWSALASSRRTKKQASSGMALAVSPLKGAMNPTVGLFPASRALTKRARQQTSLTLISGQSLTVN